WQPDPQRWRGLGIASALADRSAFGQGDGRCSLLGSTKGALMTAASKPLARLCLSACVLAAAAFAGKLPSLRAEATVNVILWFDTEDYLLPASDDAALRVASILSSRGIRATFKVVGEKARTLERRGRKDVIEALGRHDIGYHSNFHSVHPTPA